MAYFKLTARYELCALWGPKVLLHVIFVNSLRTIRKLGEALWVLLSATLGIMGEELARHVRGVECLHRMGNGG